MRTNILRAVTALIALFLVTVSAQAQFETGGAYIGPHFGVGSYQNSLSFGGDFEYGLTKPGEVGSGRVGIGATVDYWSWDNKGFDNSYYWSYSWMPIGVYSAYHFDLSNRKLDLYGGLGLGYTVVTAEWHGAEGIGGSSASYSSGLYWSLVAGMRYFFTPNFAGHAKVGLGASLLSLGVNFGL